jgi:site-specific DNA-methyltransferase (adenine-specific)
MTITNQDCLEYLQTLPSNSVDLILIDPPYFEIMKNDWDNQWATEELYLDWCKKWTEECERVLKPNRCFCVWGTTKTDTFLRYKLNVLGKIPSLYYQNWFIWHYDWGGRTKKTFPRKHEDCLMYSKGEEFPFDSFAVSIPYKMEKNVRKGVIQKKEGKVPTDVWEKNNHTASKEYVNWHPTQKPLSILERLILAFTKEGATVLDIFSGSGSTAISCDNTNRIFIGCELSKEYWEKSCERRSTWIKPKPKKEKIVQSRSLGGKWKRDSVADPFENLMVDT